MSSLNISKKGQSLSISYLNVVATTIFLISGFRISLYFSFTFKTEKSMIRLSEGMETFQFNTPPTAISLVHFTPNAYHISRKTIAKLTVLSSNS